MQSIELLLCDLLNDATGDPGPRIAASFRASITPSAEVICHFVDHDASANDERVEVEPGIFGVQRCLTVLIPVRAIPRPCLSQHFQVADMTCIRGIVPGPMVHALWVVVTSRRRAILAIESIRVDMKANLRAVTLNASDFRANHEVSGALGLLEFDQPGDTRRWLSRRILRHDTLSVHALRQLLLRIT